MILTMYGQSVWIINVFEVFGCLKLKIWKNVKVGIKNKDIPRFELGS